MKRKATILSRLAAAGVMLAATALVQAQSVRQEWVARYNGPGNDRDEARAIAVDGSGNVYVTGDSHGGSTDGDYATVKYDRNGNRLWARRYNGPGNGLDEAYAMGLDDAGNLYVTGSSAGGVTYQDYATIKYDPAGNELWVARYNGPGDNWDEARALAVDGSGNVYVTGSSRGIGTRGDYATIKYDPAGNQLWVARYDGPYKGSDTAEAIVLDGSGNVYVTGKSAGGGRGVHPPPDYATVKYDPAGKQLWAARYDGPAESDDEARALAVDGSGNVYVTGFSLSANGWYDYATIKYDPAGNELWVARYTSPGMDIDKARAIALDDSANIYVTGFSNGLNAPDCLTIKYDTAGNQLWTARYEPGNASGSAIALDSSGNVYVAGSSYDYITIKYDPTGKQLWLARYNGPGNGADGARAIAVVDSGNVYVTGLSKDPDTGFDYGTIKYSQRVLGDLNCDESVDLLDVEPFIMALLDPLEYENQYPDCDIANADINMDGSVDLKDIEPFIELLLGR